MEQEILRLTRQGKSDEGIAALLTEKGYRSPRPMAVLPSTVKILRLRHCLFRKRSQSHPRHIPGYLTVTQIARKLRITPHWIFDRLHNGTIELSRDPQTKLYLFPDQPRTIALFKRL